MKKHKIWMMVEANERSLPIAWADNPRTLAQMVGVLPTTIISEASRFRDGKIGDRWPKYIKVEVEDDD